MAKVRFIAKHIKSGQSGRIILDLINSKEIEWVGEFFKKKNEYEEKSGQDKLLEIEMSVYYKRKTANQWGLYQELIGRLAMKQNCGKDNIHKGIKFNYYPEDSSGMKKSSATLSADEMWKINEYTISECYEKDIDIRDIYTIWVNMRYQLENDPLEGSYRNMNDYKLTKPFCEACLKPLLADEGQMAHIISSGVGVSDDPWNRLRLCTDCHIMTQHAKGWLELIGKCPIIEPKVRAAWDRAGVSGKEQKEDKLSSQEVEAKRILDEAENSEYGLF